MTTILPCRPDDNLTILAIVNAAAERYRGAIPDDCWHEPYMSADELARDIGSGVAFYGCEDRHAQLVGIMGMQRVKDVTLVRHAYVRPTSQGMGIGGRLLRHLERLTDQRILIGTWAAAAWAIGFYQRHGYQLVSAQAAPELLRTYWSVSPRQIETSVVLERTVPERE
jgi:GNAT superfamily N-acetyltransferase